MKEQKNIDRLFQEKFKNFEASPDDAVWNRINAQLQEKKERRKLIPIWWRIGGIAAGLALLLTLGYAIINNSDSSENGPTEVVETEKPVETKNNKATNNNSEKQTPEKTLLNNNLISKEDGIVTENSKEDSEDNTKAETPFNTVLKEKTAIVNAPKEETVTTTSNSTTHIVNSNNKQQLIDTNIIITDSNNITNQNKVSNNKEAGVVSNELPINLPEQKPLLKEETSSATPASKEDGIAELTNSEKEESIKSTTDEQKPSIEDAMASTEDEDDINEKEKDVVDRWSVTPNVAPVYFNTLGSKGSSIHSQFNNNSKSGDLNMSYGVNASYALSNKIAVRAGVNRVNVGYKTNEVIVYQNIGTAVNSDLLRNIKLDPSAQNTSIISSATLAFAEVPQIVSRNFKASLNQEITFIEVPVEVEYKLIDKKVDINLIGGFSTLFLNDNTIYAEILDETTPIGEANNINDVSFSANFGVGLEVKISKRFNLNLEPTFKYQINTFNNTSGGFKPYMIGINSGLKFKF